jgi:hypothetical protein
MTAETEKLGGRLPLLDPRALSPAQKAIYEHTSLTSTAWTCAARPLAGPSSRRPSFSSPRLPAGSTAAA